MYLSPGDRVVIYRRPVIATPRPRTLGSTLVLYTLNLNQYYTLSTAVYLNLSQRTTALQEW